MKLRAVIFDVYGTLLTLGAAPTDAGTRWRWLWESTFGGPPAIGIEAFVEQCEAVIDRDHAAARARGIAYPEVYWPGITEEVIPALVSLPGPMRQSFDRAHVSLLHSTALMPEAAPVLRLLLGCGIAVGIASNAQPYTLRELDEALRRVGLGTDIFAPDLCFWSFEHGFSKPDPHVFQVLTARLRVRGIRSSETLMIGDHSGNDIQPARASAWETFHLHPPDSQAIGPGGDWQALARWLDGRLIA